MNLWAYLLLWLVIATAYSILGNVLYGTIEHRLPLRKGAWAREKLQPELERAVNITEPGEFTAQFHLIRSMLASRGITIEGINRELGRRLVERLEHYARTGNYKHVKRICEMY